MTISALLINHNGGHTILTAIQSLLDQRQTWEQIVVVDNGSTDGSNEEIRQHYPTVQLVELEENLGLPYARNLGISKIDGDLVLLMDDDVYLSPGSLEHMINAMQDTDAAVICPRIVLQPENEIIQCDGASIHYTGTLALRHSFEKITSHPPRRYLAAAFIGACLLFNANLLRELGGFDEDYFFYFEDLELSFRLSSLGHKIYCEENAVAVHERGAGTKGLSFRGKGEYPAKRAYYNLRHRWLTILIHFQLSTLILLFPALALYEMAAFIESFRRGWTGTYFKAALSVVQKRKSILQRRRYWGSKRKISDRHILTGGKLPLSQGFIEPSRIKLARALDLVLNSYWNMANQWL
jgi:GT2 family glycosyltransferase